MRAHLKAPAMSGDGSASRMVRVLGLDPASAGPTGYGIVETDGRDCRTIHFGAFQARRGAPLAARLCEIHRLVAQLVEEFRPDVVALESVFTALNMRTALQLAEVRGVVQLAAAERDVPIHSYSPREVKACVAGYGDASKHQMQLMVRAILNMTETPEPADAADALAVALCHIQSARVASRLAAAGVSAPPERRTRARSAPVRVPVLS